MNDISDIMTETFGAGWPFLVGLGIAIIIIAISRKF